MLNRRFGLVVLILALSFPIAAQSHRNPLLTAIVSGTSVRYAGFGEVSEMALKVVDPEGQAVFDAAFVRGNVLDYALVDANGKRLGDGSYLFVVTIHDLDGGLAQKFGTFQIAGHRVMLESASAGTLTPSQVQALNASKPVAELAPIDRIGIDMPGEPPMAPIVVMPPEPVTTATPGGSVVAIPRADVAGTGTTNAITKWIDTAGSLGDSNISEVGGKVGIGTMSPGAQLHVFGAATADVFSGLGPDVVKGPAMNYGYAGNSFGRGAGFFNVRPDTAAAAPNPSLRFETINQQRMIITNLGNIGIGTGFTPATVPTDKLEVGGNVKLVGTGHAFVFPDATMMTTAGATLDANTFKADQTVNGNITATGAISGNTLSSTTTVNGATASFTGNIVSSGGAIDAGTQFNVGGVRALAQPGGNLFVGEGAGASVNSGAELVFVGFHAGAASTSTTASTFVGAYAGEHDGASANSFFGDHAGNATTTGAENSFFGQGAGRSNTTGIFNSYFGQIAGAVSTGSDNSYFGASAGVSGLVGQSSSGSDNSLFGFDAGANITSGSRNTFIGGSSGTLEQSGSGNTFVGYQTGQSNSDESENTLIGHRANGTAGITNATAIGSYAMATQSNTVILGAISGLNSAPADTAVGIGTTAPQQMLSIRDGIRLDQGNRNDGSVTLSTLTFGSGSGEGIGSQRTAGATQFGLDFYTAFAKRVSIAQSGELTLNVLGAGGGTNLCLNSSNVVSTCGSSIRYKDSIADFSGGLEVIRRLRPVTFRWKSDGKPDVGLIAEEVNKVEPLLSIYNASGDVEGVKYDHLTVLLINAVNAQQKAIADLEEKNARLENDERRLERELQTVTTINH